jgi:hypothetical protein
MLTQCAHTKTHRDKPRTHAHTHKHTRIRSPGAWTRICSPAGAHLRAHTHTCTHLLICTHLAPGHGFAHLRPPAHTHAHICSPAPTWRLDTKGAHLCPPRKHTCVHICTHFLTRTHLHTHTCTHLRTCAHLAPGHACAHLCPPPRTHMCTHMHTFPHLHPPAHAHMHIFAHLRPPRAWTCTICLPVPTCAGLRPGWIAAQHPQLGVANKFF